MIHELRAYDLKPGTGPAYLELFLRRGIASVTRHLPFAGYWLTESGRLNRLYHLWIYESLEERAAARVALAGDREWMDGFVPEGFPLILSQRTRLMQQLEGSADLERAVQGRRQGQELLSSESPIFAETLHALTEGDVRPEAPLIGRWRVLSGEDPGTIVTLWGGDPWDSAPGALRHEILRPVSLSPLR